MEVEGVMQTWSGKKVGGYEWKFHSMDIYWAKSKNSNVYLVIM
jgi:hypothetical protein